MRLTLGLEVPNEPQIPDADSDKLRGGYYTPVDVGALLARWAIRSGDARVLEPSCGDGRLIAQAAELLGSDGSITGVELFPEEAAKAVARGSSSTRVVAGDFFTWYLAEQPDQAFDAVIGNPPFIRYQNFPEDHRDAAFAVMRQEGLHPSRLTNAWVPFVVAATRALKPGGRLAIVLPAELLQVTYAAELREYLIRKYRRLVIVTFRQLIFAGIQQETILLFGIREDSTSPRVKWIELDGVSDLEQIEHLALNNGVAADLNHAREKWTQFYLSAQELALIRGIETSAAFTTLGTLASVDVGVVTGRNEFFVMTPSEARDKNVLRFCQPLVGRSSQIPGLMFMERDWARLRDDDGRCLLLQLGKRPRSELPNSVIPYVQEGERAGFHHGFKLRIRLPSWWHVPSVWSPDAFLLRQIHDGPRVIVNKAGVTCTDTIHRVRLRDGVAAPSLAAVSVTSLAFAFAEIRGRSYGGGVLELEPTEAESLPWFSPVVAGTDFGEIDAWARQLKADALLEKTDAALLERAGLSRDDCSVLRGIWSKLYSRRVSRKRISAPAIV